MLRGGCWKFPIFLGFVGLAGAIERDEEDMEAIGLRPRRSPDPDGESPFPDGGSPFPDGGSPFPEVEDLRLDGGSLDLERSVERLDGGAESPLPFCGAADDATDLRLAAEEYGLW